MKHILLSIAICISATVALAQTGSIEGKVTSAESGELLRGATISLTALKKGAYSDTKGTYRIKKVPAGTYSLKVSYVGYQTTTFDGIVVADNAPTTFNIVLTASKELGKEVVVEAAKVTDNAGALLTQRKNAAQVSDGIGREEISKMPDSDAGQSLKRVSGVTLVEGKFIYVRGVSDRYSNTTLNGAALTSTEPDKKAFAFDMFPSELLENANILKSFTPDLPGNFAGGLVQLNTIDFPSKRGVKVSASQGYNNYVTFKNGGYYASAGANGDALAMGASSRSMPAAVPSDRLGMNQLLRDVRSGNPDAIARLDGIGRSFNNNLWNTSAETVTPNGSMSVTYSDVVTLENEDEIGIVASGNYGNSWQNNEIIRGGILSNPNDYLFRYTGQQSSRSTSFGGLFNVAYRIGSTSRIGFKNTYNRTADFENVYLTGENFAQSQAQKLFSFQYVEKSLYSGTVSGEHTLTDLSNALIDWRVGYSRSTREEPDFKRLQFLRNASDVGQPYFAAFDLSPQGAGSRAGRFFSNLVDNAVTSGLNLTIPVTTDIKVKVGGLLENRSRRFNARSLTIVQGLENDITDRLTIPDNNSLPNLGVFFADSNYSVEKGRLSYSEDSKLSDQYDAQEHLLAGYAMIDLPFTVAGMESRIITGARIEKNIQKLNSFDVTDNRVNVNQDLVDILPAFNLILRPMKDFNIRASASQTLARPSLREFAPFQFYDFQQQATVAGNPNLVRSLIQNYDLRLEYFTGAGEVLSVSGFYKRFENAIEETLFPQQSELVRSFANATGPADNIGVEIEARKNLGSIADWLMPFTVSINASIVDSRIVVEQAGVKDTRSMWGQSPYSINGSVYYSNVETGTNVSLAYNTYGRRIIQVNLVGVFQGNPHVYELPRDVVDFSIQQTVGESLELKVSVRDLLNQPLKWEQNGALIQSNIRGMSMSLGLGYRL